jgi:SAM-dependent methyltransferase
LARLGHDGLVLDLGCGHGFWMGYMGARGMRAVGVEPEIDRVGEAAEAAEGGPVVAADGARLPVRDATVALVWCIHVLHHLDDPVQALAEVARVLRPGGHLVLAETVEDNPAIRIGRRLRPEWDGVPIRSRFTAATLGGLLEDAGLEVADRRQHSLVSFAAWALPRGKERAWRFLSRAEGVLPPWAGRWGAHAEFVARRRPQR